MQHFQYNKMQLFKLDVPSQHNTHPESAQRIYVECKCFQANFIVIHILYLNLSTSTHSWLALRQRGWPVNRRQSGQILAEVIFLFNIFSIINCSYSSRMSLRNIKCIVNVLNAFMSSVNVFRLILQSFIFCVSTYPPLQFSRQP